MNGVIAQITDTPEYNGIDVIDCNILKVGTQLNENYIVSYNDLNATQKRKVDDFVNLMISLAPSSNI